MVRHPYAYGRAVKKQLEIVFGCDVNYKEGVKRILRTYQNYLSCGPHLKEVDEELVKLRRSNV